MSTTLVLPGESLPTPSTSSSSSKLTLGPGIAPLSTSTSTTSQPPQLVGTRLGVLRSSKGKEKESVWVESSSTRYIPAQRDLVLGTIIARHAEGYRVDIGSATMATLDALAFEGATKRSKPNLKIGTLVYARVSAASRDMEPDLECFDAATGKSDGFGELKGGLMVNCSLQLCRKLLNPKHSLLPGLAAHFPFETAIGLNGRVWIKAAGVSETIVMRRVIEAVDEGRLSTEKKDVDRAVKEYLA